MSAFQRRLMIAQAAAGRKRQLPVRCTNDRMEMAHSGEGRLPFLDHHVAAEAARMRTRADTLLMWVLSIYVLHDWLGMSSAVARRPSPGPQGVNGFSASGTRRSHATSGACSAATMTGFTPERATAADTSSRYCVGALTF
jgi:hypothetical protein